MKKRQRSLRLSGRMRIVDVTEIVLLTIGVSGTGDLGRGFVTSVKTFNMLEKRK
jgi:hypothetical protein